LPVTGELLRGSLIERTVRHTRGCTICAGGGHRLWVLTVGYAGGRTRQLSLRREQVEEARRWLGKYHKLKEALEEICELNHGLLRPNDATPRRARARRDKDAPCAAQLWRRAGERPARNVDETGRSGTERQ
jgi:Family of unknown function (DUF6788)